MSTEEVSPSPYLVGSYAPTQEEHPQEALTVIEGAVPKDLDGLLVRNGPNPRFPPRGRYHWFDGDGMLHAVRLQDGRATYQNRWVRTQAFAQEQEAGGPLWGGIMESIRDNPKGAPYKDTANTDVIFHDGKLKALWYLCGRAYEVDPNTLNTLGPSDFAGAYRGPVSAHSKVDETTGHLAFFDFGPKAPFMHFGLADAHGRIEKHIEVPLPGPRLPHDLALTENFAILMDLPIVFDEEALAKGRWRTSFNRELPARFALVPRAVGNDAIRWFEASPCYIYHSINAWEEDGAVVLVGCRVPEPYQAPRPEEGPYAVMMATLRIRAELYMWRFDLETGACTETRLCDRNTEFPSIDRRRIGRKSQFSWNVIIGDEPTVFFDGLVKYDTGTGASDTLRFGPGRRGSESPFAPRVGSQAEDDGYLLTFLHDERERRSELWITPAQEPSRGPVARLLIPGRVPLGFHATWVPGNKLTHRSAS